MDTDAVPSEQHFFRVGGISSIAGAIVLLVATMLHPLEADPNEARAAFAEYALDTYWVATHLGQLLGVVLIAAGMAALSWMLRGGRGGPWALLAALAAVASVAVAAALQAVDGIALKFMVDRLAATPADSSPYVFEAAFGVRQIEIGFASMMSILFGLTVILYGVAMLVSSGGSRGLGVLGVMAGGGTVVAGIVQAHTGFSAAAMAASMPATLLVLIWTVCVGVLLLRASRPRAAAGA